MPSPAHAINTCRIASRRNRIANTFAFVCELVAATPFPMDRQWIVAARSRLFASYNICEHVLYECTVAYAAGKSGAVSAERASAKGNKNKFCLM